MNIKLYIGSEQADFNERFNIVFSPGDIRDLGYGNNNKSYPLAIPLTKTNKRLLKYITQVDVKTEQAATGRLYLGEILVISGTVKVLGYNDYAAKVIIDSDDWMDPLKNSKLSALDLSAEDHALTSSTVEASWSASFPYYRYPMINYGGLMSLEQGPTAKWQPNDFVPMISIAKLITSILAGHTISSNWLASTFVKDLFILGKETASEEDFISNKKLKVIVNDVNDNYATGSSSTNLQVAIAKTVQFGGITTDEGADFTSETTYTVPVSGTYRFTAGLRMTNTAYGNPFFNIQDEDVTIEIRRNGSAIASAGNTNYLGVELLDGILYTADTGLIHLAAGDLITAYMDTRVYGNATSGTQTVTTYANLITNLENFWSIANRYTGIGATIQLEQYLPDMNKIDFLTAIRDIFNLRFWYDKQKRTIYIEPWDQFISATTVDLTSKIHFEDNPGEMISPSYGKEIVLNWEGDDRDVAYQEYMKVNAYGPGRKSIALNSIYAKKESDYKTAKFSTIMTGYSPVIQQPGMVQIYAEIPIYPYVFYNRLIGFNTKLVHWDGLTSGFTWNYNGTNKTTYPKISAVDFQYIYENYWMKLLHYIDQGKIYPFRMKVDPVFLNQFFTVIATATSEGFRPTYQVTIKGIKNNFILQKITSDGELAEIELILKQ